jgi:hypothetical protein
MRLIHFPVVSIPKTRTQKGAQRGALGENPVFSLVSVFLSTLRFNFSLVANEVLTECAKVTA